MNRLLLLPLVIILLALGDAPIAGLATSGTIEAPVMYFGVKTCGASVLWMVDADGHMRRFDKDHPPPDAEAFARSIAALPHDLVEMDCITNL